MRSRNQSLDDVPGWFTPTDQLLFEWLLSWQARTGSPGDAVELGVFEGKSAIHLARYLLPTERLTVCDVFEGAATEPELHGSTRHRYRALTQATFEANFLDFHTELPQIVRGLSSAIEEHVEPGSCRFVHVDASHLYEHVRADAAASRRLLRPDGIVVFDDYRTEHALGTAAAVWETILGDGLQPICATSMKMYGTWGDPAPAQAELARRVAERDDHGYDVVKVYDGRELMWVAERVKRAERLRRRARHTARRMRRLGHEALARADRRS